MFMVGSCAWHVGEQLSSDSIAMLLGLFFGIFAGLPVALLAMHNNRIIAEKEENRRLQMTQLEWKRQHFTCKYCGQPFNLVNGEWRHSCTTYLGQPKRVERRVIDHE